GDDSTIPGRNQNKRLMNIRPRRGDPASHRRLSVAARRAVRPAARRGEGVRAVKARVLSALVLLLAADPRADPPGAVERTANDRGFVDREGSGGQAYLAVLRRAADDDLAVLCELRGLRVLGLVDARVTDEGLRTVAAPPQVSELVPAGDTFTDAGLRHLE